MKEQKCPHCRGQLFSREDRCRWCNARVPAVFTQVKPGDLVRICNLFKGGLVEEVIVDKVDRGGHGIEFKDSQGRLWGYLQPSDILAVVRRAKRS